MKKIIFYRGIIVLSNIILSTAAISISQCCHGVIYQPEVDANLKTQIHQAKNKARLKKE